MPMTRGQGQDVVTTDSAGIKKYMHQIFLIIVQLKRGGKKKKTASIVHPCAKSCSKLPSHLVLTIAL